MTVTVAKLTCNTTWAGILALNYVSQPKAKLIRPSKASPRLEMITAGLYFRIQWILWRLLGIFFISRGALTSCSGLRSIVNKTVNKT